MELPIVLGGVAIAVAAIAALEILVRRSGHAAPPAAAVDARERGDVVRAGLRATRERLGGRLRGVFGRSDASIYDDIEEVLIASDVGVMTAHTLVGRLRHRLGPAPEAAAARAALREEIASVFRPLPPRPATAGPEVILVTGVNGVGKTTTVAKLAARHRDAGRRVLLVAADTFRAAASEQLETWAERLGVEVVSQGTGGSPAAVAYDGMQAAMARGADVVLVDTAGRLHTHQPLVDELRKVRRVIGEGIAGAPHQSLLVIDATTGQNALAQARRFMEAIDVTGIVLTKLDGTARGGVAIAIAEQLGLPITDIGVGEGPQDLRPFDREEFLSALLDVAPAND